MSDKKRSRETETIVLPIRSGVSSVLVLLLMWVGVVAGVALDMEHMATAHRLRCYPDISPAETSRGHLGPGPCLISCWGEGGG